MGCLDILRPCVSHHLGIAVLDLQSKPVGRITIIFLSRFMLNLRGVYFTTESGEDSQYRSLSDPHFASNLVGNLGAPLDIELTPSAILTRGTSDYDADVDYMDDSPEVGLEMSADPLSAGIGERVNVEMRGPTEGVTTSQLQVTHPNV